MKKKFSAEQVIRKMRETDSNVVAPAHSDISLRVLDGVTLLLILDSSLFAVSSLHRTGNQDQGLSRLPL